MSAYIRILRPINLLIVALTQGLIYIIIKSAYVRVEVTPVLEGHLIFLFILCTALLAGSANIINDIIDIDVDKANKKKPTLGGLINIREAWIYYVLICLIGLGIAIYIGLKISRPGLIIIYPLALISLFSYSKYLKATPLIGNITVAGFCSFVPGILWYGELSSITQIKSIDIFSYELITYLLSGFVIFSFMTNLVRELVKDIEDYPGDSKLEINTYPVAYGIPRAKLFAIFNMMMTLLIVVIWWYKGKVIYVDSRIHNLAIIPLIFPPLVIINHLTRIPDFIRVRLASYWLKVYMLIGLIILFILS